MTALPAVDAVDRPVFVIGCGRSGTTMLFQMLKSHPALQPTTGHPDGEDHVGWIEHAGAAIAGLYGNSDTGDLGHLVGQPCCMHMSESEATDQTRRSMARYYCDEVLGNNVGKRVVNKCPHLSNKVGYVRGLFPDARFVHIVRDPVAMVASWINIMALVPDLAVYWPHVPYPCLWVYERTSEALQRLEADRIYPGQGLLLFADYWREINGNIPIQAERFADQLLTIRYEDLIARPGDTLRVITDFCEIDPFQSVPVQIDGQRNSSRRDLLSSGDVESIRRITAPVATRLGYG
jgi:hypothetical protein